MDFVRNECLTSGAGPSGLSSKTSVLEEKSLVPTAAGSLPHQMQEVDATNETTIMDYLNEDCWRMVLNFLPIKDIIRSETVSRQWQGVVLTYLRRVRYCGYDTVSNVVKTQRSHSLGPWMEYSRMFGWTNKLGPSVATICLNSEEDLKIFGENCPNLDAVKFYDVSEQLLLSNQSENFKWLQQICFKRCPASDRCLSGFIKSNVLNELEILYNNQLTGQCLVNIKPGNLKTLVLKRCHALDPCRLPAAADRFTELTKLELIDIPFEIFKQLHVVLDKTPKLEHLRIRCIYGGYETLDDLFKSVCRLERLKHLSVYEHATDKNVADVARCCVELRSLELVFCRNVTVHGLEALCHYAGDRLIWLGIIGSRRVTENDLVQCIFSCPNLTTLNVHHTFEHSQVMAAAAAAARREMGARVPLELRVDYYKVRRLYEVLDKWGFDFDIEPWVDVKFYENDSDEEDYNVFSEDYTVFSEDNIIYTSDDD